MSDHPWDVALALSLWAGAVVNARGALGFFTQPERMAQDLSLGGQFDPAQVTPLVLVLMRLVGVCLVALAMFYVVTALNPRELFANVIVASLARFSGVVYYAWNLAKWGGPAKFKGFLGLNLSLAVAHAGLLWASWAAAREGN